MKVELLNPEVVRDLYKNHGEFACVCYDTPVEKAEGVGKHCQDNGHFSGSRCEYIKFRISDIDRGTAEQCLRHEIGTDVPFEYQDNYSFSDYMEQVKDIPADHVVKNMASFRYIDKSGFKWETPRLIRDYPHIWDVYKEDMAEISRRRDSLRNMLLKAGEDPKKVNEAVNFYLPRATLSEFVIGFTPEALIQFMHKRLCNRAQEFIWELAFNMKFEVRKFNPRFADKELVPQCEHLMWCPEGKSCCGYKPTKEKLKEKLENGLW